MFPALRLGFLVLPEDVMAAVQRCLQVPHEIGDGYCGLHLTVRLPHCYPDYQIVEAAKQHGITAQALSGFVMSRTPEDNGFVLGYGNASADKFEPLLRKLSSLILDIGTAYD